MEPWEQEWYYTRALEQRQAQRPRCALCGDILEDLDIGAVCRCCQSQEEDE